MRAYHKANNCFWKKGVAFLLALIIVSSGCLSEAPSVRAASVSGNDVVEEEQAGEMIAGLEEEQAGEVIAGLEDEQAGEQSSERQSVTIELSTYRDDQGKPVLYWDFMPYDIKIECAYIYRNEELLTVLHENDYFYHDESAELSSAYTYYIEMYDENETLLGRSNSVHQSAVEPLTISENYILTGDIEVAELTIVSGNIDLNHHQLRVYGDVEMTGGNLLINQGSLYCHGDLNQSAGTININGGGVTAKGDYIIGQLQDDNSNNSMLIMQSANSTVSVYGTFCFGSSIDHARYLTAGYITMYGDFISNKNFVATDKNMIYFAGKEKQIVSMDDGSRLAAVTLYNSSEEGVCFTQGVRLNEVYSQCNVSFGEEPAVFGWTLQEDEVFEGNLNLFARTLDLNGHTLTVKGDFIQGGGEVVINGGKLLVEGDYQIQNRCREGEDYCYTSSAGKLAMKNEEDYVLVEGDFIVAVAQSTYDCFTDGVLEVKGDVIESDTISGYLCATGSHTIKLSGSDKQVVHIRPGNSFSYLNNLEIENTSEDGISFDDGVCVRGTVTDNHCPKDGYLYIVKSTSFEGRSYRGNIAVKERVNIDDDLTIKGDVFLNAGFDINATLNIYGNVETAETVRITINKSRLNIFGDLITGYRGSWIELNYADSYLYVEGDWYYRGTNSSFRQGTIEIKGDFDAGYFFRATESNRILLSGEKEQKLTVPDGSYLATLELQNYSEEGVITEAPIQTATFIGNDCNFRVGAAQGVYGWKLEEDEEIAGDLFLAEETLDLNGHRLTITGDLIQSGGTIRINGGKLIVEGDYRLETKRQIGDSYSYTYSRGILVMQNAEDYVLVKGNFMMDTATSQEGCLTNGALEVRGDFNVLTYARFMATDGHTVILSKDACVII